MDVRTDINVTTNTFKIDGLQTFPRYGASLFSRELNVIHWSDRKGNDLAFILLIVYQIKWFMLY